MAASSILPLSWARAERTRNSMFEGTTREDRDSAGADPANAATRIQDSIPIPFHEVREDLWSSFTPSPPDRDKEMEGGRNGPPSPVETTRGLYQLYGSGCKCEAAHGDFSPSGSLRSRGFGGSLRPPASHRSP